LKASVFVGSGISSRDHAGRLPHEARVVKSIMRQSVVFPVMAKYPAHGSQARPAQRQGFQPESRIHLDREDT
jgi:hypothetical protein